MSNHFTIRELRTEFPTYREGLTDLRDLLSNELAEDVNLRIAYQGFINAFGHVLTQYGTYDELDEIDRFIAAQLNASYRKVANLLKQKGYKLDDDLFSYKAPKLAMKLAQAGLPIILAIGIILAVNVNGDVLAQGDGDAPTPDEAELYLAVMKEWENMRYDNCANWIENSDLNAPDCPWNIQNGAEDNQTQWGASSPGDQLRIIDYFQDPRRFNGLLGFGFELQVPEKNQEGANPSLGNILWFVASEQFKKENNGATPNNDQIWAILQSWNGRFIRIGLQLPLANQFIMGKFPGLDFVPEKLTEAFGLTFRFDIDQFNNLDLPLLMTEQEVLDIAARAMNEEDLRYELAVTYVDMVINNNITLNLPGLGNTPEEVLASGVFDDQASVENLVNEIVLGARFIEIDVFNDQFSLPNGELADTQIDTNDGKNALG
jgi:hypothetical protein